jgi:hypothetical protein
MISRFENSRVIHDGMSTHLVGGGDEKRAFITEVFLDPGFALAPFFYYMEFTDPPRELGQC